MMEFLTGVGGVLTGIAAVITAVATILGLSNHGSSATSAAAGPTPAVTVPAAPVATTAAPNTPPGASATTSATAAANGGFRLLWGPAPFVVSNDGSGISSVPPTSQGGNLDLYDDGSGFGQMDGALLAVWHGATAPTPAQCLNQVQTQSAGTEVVAPVGTTVCVQSSSGQLAIITVTGTDPNSTSAETTTTIWAKD
ncbi:hypothetical protein [Streptacidiphilus albus]|uniref:hypothetical protein n=1 Tax=Streptacidiphilus albus TaxID=105425 RepID=UPI000A3EB41F|nr:hypothetical protein [Streptacidiphilus albus]